MADQVVPERRWHTVEVQWVVPPEVASYRTQPCGSLSHLIGCPPSLAAPVTSLQA